VVLKGDAFSLQSMPIKLPCMTVICKSILPPDHRRVCFAPTTAESFSKIFRNISVTHCKWKKANKSILLTTFLQVDLHHTLNLTEKSCLSWSCQWNESTGE